MADELNVGDVVVLKSGGPDMTIKEIGDYGIKGDGALCVWFDGKQQKSEVFALPTLKKAD